MSRRLAIGLIACLLLLVASPASAEDVAAPTVEDLVASLKQDPIVVETSMGMGDALAAHQMLTDVAADVDVPVYVVLATTPPELADSERPAESAAAVLQTELGDGLYIVEFTDGPSYSRGIGTAKDLDLSTGYIALNRAREIGPYEYNSPSSVLSAELILRGAADPGTPISDSQLREWIDTPYAFKPEDDDFLSDARAKRWVTASAGAFTVLIAGLTLTALVIRAPLSGRRRSATSAEPAPSIMDPADVDRTRRRFEKLTATQLQSPHANSAEQALIAADIVARTGERLDAIGAWVLSQYAGRELDRMARPSLDTYRPCIINPEHGEAHATVRLAGSSIDAPACAACAKAPAPFLSASGRGRRSYLDTNSVWARTGFGALVDDLPRQVIADRDSR